MAAHQEMLEVLSDPAEQVARANAHVWHVGCGAAFGASRGRGSSLTLGKMTPFPAILKVSKTDAARRQLEAAIRLWYFDGDAVSVHTLAAAAHQLIHDLGKARGVATALRELPNVRPEFRKQMRDAVTRDENFFKHADRDPDALLEFKPITTTYMLGDAVFTYEALTSERPPILRTFQMWLMLHNPDLVKQEFREQWLAQVKGMESVLRRTSKQEFFSLYQSLIAKNESA